MRYLRRSPALMLAILAASSALQAAPAGAAGQAECREVALAMRPGWISSATYVPALHKVLVVDSAMNRLLLVGEDGQVTSLADPEVAKRAKLPSLVAPTPEGFALKLVDPEILTFDTELRLRGAPKSLAAAGGPGRPAVGSISQWTVAGRSIVAYGSLRSPSFPQGYELGFIRAPLDGRAPAEMLQRFDDNSYYVLGYQYVAAIGPVAYFLRLGGEATLFAAAPSRKPVAVPNPLPPPFRVVPKLQTPFEGPGDAPAHYAEVERLTIPAGLYGGPDGFLYLLTRQPGKAAGETDWSLYRLNAADGKVLGKGELRTKAKHLTVVPAPDAWYFFERGEPDTIGRQPIGSMVVVPSARLTRTTLAGGALCSEVRR
jgi:hypothetical protein